MKNANFIQLHLEKLVLGLGVLFLLAVVYLYVISSPYKASIANREVAPSEVAPLIEQKVNELQGRLDRDDFDTSQILGEARPQDAEAFREFVENPLIIDEDTLVPIEGPGLSTVHVPDQTTIPDYWVPSVPLPRDMVAAANYAQFDPRRLTPDQERTIRQQAGNIQGNTIHYVSVQGEFDLADWRERIITPEGNARIMERAWWSPVQAVAAVYLQRERLINASRDEWGETILIEPLPGYVGYMDSPQSTFTLQEAQAIREEIIQARINIAETPFPVLNEQFAWMQPASKRFQLSDKDHAALSSLQKKITRVESTIERLERQIGRQDQRDQNDSRRPANTRRPQPRPDDGGGGFNDFGNPGNDRPSRQRQQPNNSNDPQSRLNDAYAELQQLTFERDELVGYLDFLQQNGISGGGTRQPGFGEPGIMEPGMEPGFGAPGFGQPGLRQPGFGRPGQDGMGNQVIEEDTTITVWAHDFSAKPGETYRYRVLVKLINPLFTQRRLKEEQRAENEFKLTTGTSDEELASADWAEPVKLHENSYFFVTGGVADSEIARIDVWKLIDGQWRTSEFDVTPGDPIGGPVDLNETSFDLSLGKYMLSLILDTVGNQSGGISGILYSQDSGEIVNQPVDSNNDLPNRLTNEMALTELFVLPNDGFNQRANRN